MNEYVSQVKVETGFSRHRLEALELIGRQIGQIKGLDITLEKVYP